LATIKTINQNIIIDSNTRAGDGDKLSPAPKTSDQHQYFKPKESGRGWQNSYAIRAPKPETNFENMKKKPSLATNQPVSFRNETPLDWIN
jgi:hypothetical protein